jgi:glycine C-acetyltransferase
MGKARIRTQMCAGHDRSQLDRAIEAFIATGHELGITGRARESIR